MSEPPCTSASCGEPVSVPVVSGTRRFVGFEGENDLPGEANGSFGAGPFFTVVESGIATTGDFSGTARDNWDYANGAPEIRKRARYAMGRSRNAGETYTLSGDFAWTQSTSPRALRDVSLRLVIAHKSAVVRSIARFNFRGRQADVFKRHSVTYTTTDDDVGKDMEFWLEWLDAGQAAGAVTVRADSLRFQSLGVRPRWGVIRWDGYSGSEPITQRQEIGYLDGGAGFIRPAQHNWRAPFYATLTGEPEHPIELNPSFDRDFIRTYVDQEIDYAKEAGIDYWAVVYYPEHKPATIRPVLNVLLETPKTDVKLALIVDGGSVGWVHPATDPDPQVEWDKYVTELIEVIGTYPDRYETVMMDRPLVFILFPDALSRFLGDPVDGGVDEVEHLAAAYQRLRDAAAEVGLTNPYIVSMGGSSIWGEKFVDNAGADAASAYRPMVGGRPDGTAFGELWNNLLSDRWWHHPSFGARHRKVVLNMPAGLDATPRIEAGFGGEYGYYVLPQPDEARRLVTNTFDLVAHDLYNKHEANTLLTYAWNEFSEGGFLCPVAGERDTYDPAVDEPYTWFLDMFSDPVKAWEPTR